jgi:hypothetical protein
VFCDRNRPVHRPGRQWVEHSNASNYRRDVLRPLHKEKLVEYDQRAGTVVLSPPGVDFVESNIPLTLA